MDKIRATSSFSNSTCTDRCRHPVVPPSLQSSSCHSTPTDNLSLHGLLAIVAPPGGPAGWCACFLWATKGLHCLLTFINHDETSRPALHAICFFRTLIPRLGCGSGSLSQIYTLMRIYEHVDFSPLTVHDKHFNTLLCSTEPICCDVSVTCDWSLLSDFILPILNLSISS